jgi:hypothetical protein
MVARSRGEIQPGMSTRSLCHEKKLDARSTSVPVGRDSGLKSARPTIGAACKATLRSTAKFAPPHIVFRKYTAHIRAWQPLPIVLSYETNFPTPRPPFNMIVSASCRRARSRPNRDPPSGKFHLALDPPQGNSCLGPRRVGKNARRNMRFCQPRVPTTNSHSTNLIGSRVIITTSMRRAVLNDCCSTNLSRTPISSKRLI